jgi:dolichol-phosphate mannosyltransferase
VVVPIYLGAPFLAELYQRLCDAISPISEAFEILLVDDRGPDDSWRLIKELARKDPRVRGLQLSRNFGQHNAISAGLRESRGRYTIVMDCATCAAIGRANGSCLGRSTKCSTTSRT